MALTEIANKVADLSGNNLPNYIAKNIKLLRKRMGLSQQDLADRVGLNRGNIASYESGTAEPKICKLLRISNLFEINTHDLTRYDLSEAGQLARAMQSFNEEKKDDNKRMDILLERIEQLEVVVESVKNLYTYRAPQLDLSHPDVKAVAHYYEQMYAVTETLLDEHRALVDELKCHCS